MSSAAHSSHSRMYSLSWCQPPRCPALSSRTPALGGEPARGSSRDTAVSRREKAW